MNNKVQANGNGVGVCFILFITFLVMKLTGVIGWSWWWVTAPLWLPVAVAIGVLLIIALLAFATG